MSHRSEPELLVLHALRLKGFAEVDGIVALAALDAGDVQQRLEKLAGDDLVTRRDGRISGWALTGEGRAEHERRLRDELHRTDRRADVHAAYRGFVALNGELLALCTAWQVKPAGGEPKLNDHRDAAYDAAVVERLERVHEGIVPVLHDLTDVLDRFGPYRPRLAGALDRVRAGDGEWLTRPLIDSYHTIWFELHEDLLATLGIQRKEGET